MWDPDVSNSIRAHKTAFFPHLFNFLSFFSPFCLIPFKFHPPLFQSAENTLYINTIKGISKGSVNQINVSKSNKQKIIGFFFEFLFSVMQLVK